MTRTPHSSASARSAFVRFGTGLALAGVGTATAAAAIASTPAEAAKVDVSHLIVHGRPVRQGGSSVGLDHAGGDLRRAFKITRRAQGDSATKRPAWAAIAPMAAKQTSSILSLTR